MNRVEPLVPFHCISDFKPLEELFVGNLCGFCYSQSLTQFLKFIVRDNTHKRVQNTAEVGLVNQTIVVIIKLIKCCTQILKQRKMYRSDESFCGHFSTILIFFTFYMIIHIHLWGKGTIIMQKENIIYISKYMYVWEWTILTKMHILHGL